MCVAQLASGHDNHAPPCDARAWLQLGTGMISSKGTALQDPKQSPWPALSLPRMQTEYALVYVFPQHNSWHREEEKAPWRKASGVTSANIIMCGLLQSTRILDCCTCCLLPMCTLLAAAQTLVGAEPKLRVEVRRILSCPPCSCTVH